MLLCFFLCFQNHCVLEQFLFPFIQVLLFSSLYFPAMIPFLLIVFHFVSNVPCPHVPTMNPIFLLLIFECLLSLVPCVPLGSHLSLAFFHNSYPFIWITGTHLSLSCMQSSITNIRWITLVTHLCRESSLCFRNIVPSYCNDGTLMCNAERMADCSSNTLRICFSLVVTSAIHFRE